MSSSPAFPAPAAIDVTAASLSAMAYCAGEMSARTIATSSDSSVRHAFTGAVVPTGVNVEIVWLCVTVTPVESTLLAPCVPTITHASAKVPGAASMSGKAVSTGASHKVSGAPTISG